MNYLAVIVAAVVAMVIGFAWYAPPVFGTRWIAYLGTALGVSFDFIGMNPIGALFRKVIGPQRIGGLLTIVGWLATS